MYKKTFFVFIFIFVCFCSSKLFSQDFQKAIEYLQNNVPEKALPLFFAETEKANGNKKAYLYLSLACIQLQKYNDAIVWLQKGKEQDAHNTYLYSYNLGNAYYMQAAYEKALEAYQLSIKENPYYASAVLNKANTEMKLSQFESALASYKKYLSMEAKSSQAPAIQELILLLEGEKEKKEAERLVKQAEEKAAIERERMKVEKEKADEEARIAAEKKAEEERIARQKAESERLLAEEKARKEREQALLDEINNKLSDSDSAKTVSAGSEDTIGYSEEEGSLE